jgi:hypothetical protein
MSIERGRGEINPKLTTEQRVDLVLDLTRRINLLDDLLATARARRGATGKSIPPEDGEQSALDGAAPAVAVQLWMI